MHAQWDYLQILFWLCICNGHCGLVLLARHVSLDCVSLFQMRCCPFSCLYLFISLGFNFIDVIKLFECS